MDIYRFVTPVLQTIRRKRMARFCADMELTPQTRVLDVGGNAFNWRLAPVLPRLTFLNLASDRFLVEQDGNEQPTVALVVGRGEALPFPDRSFDIVFCNSVIEHLGDWQAQQMMAREIRRVGRRIFVQTPNRWFPLEPHYLTPGIHFLPMGLRTRLVRNFTVWGLLTRPSRAQAAAQIREIRLLTPRELALLFPDARIRRERFLGLPKSLIAVR